MLSAEDTCYVVHRHRLFLNGGAILLTKDKVSSMYLWLTEQLSTIIFSLIKPVSAPSLISLLSLCPLYKPFPEELNDITFVQTISPYLPMCFIIYSKADPCSSLLGPQTNHTTSLSGIHFPINHLCSALFPPPPISLSTSSSPYPSSSPSTSPFLPLLRLSSSISCSTPPPFSSSISHSTFSCSTSSNVYLALLPFPQSLLFCFSCSTSFSAVPMPPLSPALQSLLFSFPSVCPLTPIP